MNSLLVLIVWLVIIGVLIAVVHYIVDAIPIPAPINRIIKVVVVVIGCLVIVMALLNLVGGGGLNLPTLK